MLFPWIAEQPQALFHLKTWWWPQVSLEEWATSLASDSPTWNVELKEQGHMTQWHYASHVQSLSLARAMWQHSRQHLREGTEFSVRKAQQY